jgi:predicted ATP-binding protein involved in virulence
MISVFKSLIMVFSKILETSNLSNMRLTNIHLKNFRCYETLDLDLDPNFNIMVGINGTGKTAILEAIRIAIGSLFLDVDKYDNKIWSPGIDANDVRLSHLELQYPSSISSAAFMSENLAPKSIKLPNTVSWTRTLETHGGRTTQIHAKEMKVVSSTLKELVRSNEKKNIPLIAYYSTDRFKKEKKDTGIVADGSRLRGYYNALDPLTNIKFFLSLFKTETLSAIQYRTESVQLEAVSSAIKNCIEDCSNVYHDIKRDELIIELESIHDKMPFNSLSDGVRITLAMVMEIAFRCCLLNPHLAENAPNETSGVVLIDEIDLHLHPAWQKKIVADLRRSFPNIQFIVSTHAPLVIGSLQSGKIFTISNQQVYDFPIQYGRDANAILNEMGTSEMDDQLKSEINMYLLLIENGHGKEKKANDLRSILIQKLGKDHAEIQRSDMMLSFF